MAIIGILGFLSAMVLMLWGSMRGYHIIILTVLASVILAVSNQLPLYDTLFAGSQSFTAGMTSFIGRYFVIFLLSAVLAKYIENSGAAQSIAQYMILKTGKKNPYVILVALFAFASILTLGGVNLFVAMFVFIPLARNLFQELDMSWKLVVTPYMMGVGSFTMTTMPGTPAIQNVIIADILGTSLTVQPVFGLILSSFLIVYTLWRMKVELKDSLAKEEVFEDRFRVKETKENERIPSFARSISPLLLLFLTIIIGSAIQVENVILYALSFAVILSVLIFNPFIDSQRDILNMGAVNSITSVMAPAVTLGFGTVMSNTPSFEMIMDFFQGLPLTPLLSLIIITAILQFIIGSASGVLSIVGEKFVPLYDLSGYDLGYVHRMLLTTPAFMPPHVGAYLTFLDVSKLTHKDSFRQVMISLNGGVLLTVVLGYLLGFIFN